MSLLSSASEVVSRLVFVRLVFKPLLSVHALISEVCLRREEKLLHRAAISLSHTYTHTTHTTDTTDTHAGQTTTVLLCFEI